MRSEKNAMQNFEGGETAEAGYELWKCQSPTSILSLQNETGLVLARRRASSKFRLNTSGRATESGSPRWRSVAQ